MGDPRSSIGVQNLINNACLIMILCGFPFSIEVPNAFSKVHLGVFTHHFSFQNESSITTPALYTENEWPDFKESILVVEEEEW